MAATEFVAIGPNSTNSPGSGQQHPTTEQRALPERPLRDARRADGHNKSATCASEVLRGESSDCVEPTWSMRSTASPSAGPGITN